MGNEGNPNFGKRLPESQRAILSDRDSLAHLLRTMPSQREVGRHIGCSQQQVGKWREWHGIPARPRGMPVRKDISGMDPERAIKDPEAREMLIARACIRAEQCLPRCHYRGRPECPWNAVGFEDPDGDLVGTMLAGCPVAFYFGEDEMPPPPEADREKVKRASWAYNWHRRGKEVEQPQEEREKDTPDSFRVFLANL